MRPGSTRALANGEDAPVRGTYVVGATGIVYEIDHSTDFQRRRDLQRRAISHDNATLRIAVLLSNNIYVTISAEKVTYIVY